MRTLTKVESKLVRLLSKRTVFSYREFEWMLIRVNDHRLNIVSKYKLCLNLSNVALVNGRSIYDQYTRRRR